MSGIGDAFQPKDAIEDPQMFAGRGSQIELAMQELRNARTVIMVKGAQGAGKTSIALQLQRIAYGDQQLLDRPELNAERLTDSEFYCTYNVLITGIKKTTRGVVRQICETMAKIESDPETSGLRLASRADYATVTNRFVPDTAISAFKATLEKIDLDSPSFDHTLMSLIAASVRSFHKRVLIILDEIDQVEDLSGLAAILRAIVSNQCAIIMVGPASLTDRLIDDHSSFRRSITPIRVPPMPDEDIRDIYNRGLEYLAKRKQLLYLSSQALESAVQYANGQPWIAQLLGKRMVQNALKLGQQNIEQIAVTDALAQIVTEELRPRFETDFDRVCGGDPTRILILEELAASNAGIPLANLTRMMKQKYGIEDADVAIRAMVPNTGYYGLSISAERVNFVDPMFRTYMRLVRHVSGLTN